jgi:hypothetical protein
MGDVNSSRELLRNVVASIFIVAVTLAATWTAISFGKLALFGVVAGVALIVAAYIGVRHPVWFFYALAAVMAGLQFGRIPGINLPIYLPLAFGAVVASFLHPRLARSMHPLEFAWIALIITSGFTMALNAKGFIDYSLYIRWLIPSLLLLALVQLPRENLKRFGQIFAVVAALNGVFGMYMVAFDQNQTALNFLKPLGYLPQYTVARYAYGAAGGTGSIRLGGTWVEPNGAGLNLVVALALSILLFTAWRRTVLVLVIATALLLTLSRGSIFSVVVGVALVLIFHSMRTRDRAATISVIAVVSVGALLINAVRERLFTAFEGDDVGTAARADALRVFPGQMSGHWGSGWGWGRPEFIDPQYSYVFNLPSNAPLITLYRGGILPFLAFMAVVVISIVLSYRAMRSDSLPLAMYGGLFFGINVVQFNLDHNVADLPQSVVLWSMFLAFLLYVDDVRKERTLERASDIESPPKFEALTRPR